MSESILQSTKKILGIEEGVSAFDFEIMTHINSVLSQLTQLGVGLPSGFAIEGPEAKWADFLGADPRLNNVRTYVYLKVRMYFDPPQTGFLQAALEKQVEELEFRINVQREGEKWVDPMMIMQLFNEVN